ncbi:MAG: hypothetical protein WCF57_10980 [Pyrinomonadaceae bacterium]
MATNEDAATRQPEIIETDKDAHAPSGETASSPLLALKAVGRATRRLFGNWRAFLLLLLLYAAFVASLYFFISIREASLWQVLATFLLAVLVPVLFFIIQAMGTRYVESGVGTKELLRWSARNFWKLLVVSLPVLLVTWLIAYLFGIFQPDVSAVSEAGRAAAAASGRPVTALSTATFSWKEIIITTLRALILYLVLPLIVIRLWLAASRRSLGEVFRNLKRVLAQALAPGAVLAYAIGLLLFGVIPYFFITTNLARGGAWTEISLLVARLVLAALFMLIGWLITLGALSIINRDEG